MCAVHTLPYLSHKMVKIMFPSEYLPKFSCTNYINNFWDFIMSCYSSRQPFPSIMYKDNMHKISSPKIYLFEWCVRLLLNE